MHDSIKMVMTIVGAMIMMFSLLGGAIDGTEDKCTQESIISRVNIPYRISCELFKPRFKEDKK